LPPVLSTTRQKPTSIIPRWPHGLAAAAWKWKAGQSQGTTTTEMRVRTGGASPSTRHETRSKKYPGSDDSCPCLPDNINHPYPNSNSNNATMNSRSRNGGCGHRWTHGSLRDTSRNGTHRPGGKVVRRRRGTTMVVRSLPRRRRRRRGMARNPTSHWVPPPCRRRRRRKSGPPGSHKNGCSSNAKRESKIQRVHLGLSYIGFIVGLFVGILRLALILLPIWIARIGVTFTPGVLHARMNRAKGSSDAMRLSTLQFPELWAFLHCPFLPDVQDNVCHCVCHCARYDAATECFHFVWRLSISAALGIREQCLELSWPSDSVQH
jgi:hypothetical protein